MYNISVDLVFNLLSVLFGDVFIIVIIVFCVSFLFVFGINRGFDEMKINNWNNVIIKLYKRIVKSCMI